ncbi:hypothetical protein LJC07_08140 [Christensenellaceae bacterium OttesenSCG-928-L17]|nr:hypothetical protein [Christensenellaceae bacterium OttesenSCG-928-L17]
MIDLWEFATEKKIRVTDTDGKVFIGMVGDVTDAGERSDLEPQEDGITIWVEGSPVELLQSEIRSIEVV